LIFRTFFEAGIQMQKSFENKTLRVLTLFFFLFTSSIHATELYLEMTSQEYTQILIKVPFQKSNSALNKIIETGKRNLAWFSTVNVNRPSNQQFTLYTPDLIVGIPIDHPKE